VSDITPGSNNLAWRVTVLEREMERLKAGQPDVVAERVGTISQRITELKAEVREDIEELRTELRERDARQTAEIATQRRIMVVTFLIPVSLIAIGVELSYLLGGPPSLSSRSDSLCPGVRRISGT
jgi:chemotaxis response regulator CheB